MHYAAIMMQFKSFERLKVATRMSLSSLQSTQVARSWLTHFKPVNHLARVSTSSESLFRPACRRHLHPQAQATFERTVTLTGRTGTAHDLARKQPQARRTVHTSNSVPSRAHIMSKLDQLPKTDPTTQSNYLDVASQHVSFDWTIDFESHKIIGSATHKLAVKVDDPKEVL